MNNPARVKISDILHVCEIIKIIEEKETIQWQFNTINNIKTDEEVNILREHTSSDVSSSEYTEKQVNAKIIVSTYEFAERILELCHTGDSTETPKCVNCGELFESQTPFF